MSLKANLSTSLERFSHFPLNSSLISLKSRIMSKTESVKVVVRVRPLSSDERARGCQSIIACDSAAGQVTIRSAASDQGTAFTFNAAFGPESEQQELYDGVAFGLVESVLEGYNGTIFAYGQTGCGKTYTMSGESQAPGVIPNSFGHVFGAISDTDKSKCFLVRCSFMEIYNEEIRDLLKYDPSSKLDLREGKEQSVYVKNLTLETVSSVADLTRLMEAGGRHRTTKETMMNERSSRSHAIFTVYLEVSEEVEGRPVVKAGKLNLVDLAGSERQKKTQAVGDRLREAIEINLSLSALGNVISALVDGRSSHIPYRDSKLTRLLQDSLGGNTKTVMIAVVSPADYNAEESISTLRYASRAKRIQNKPKINEDPKDALLREYAEEIMKLKRMLADRGSGQEVVVERVVEREKIVEKQVQVYVPAQEREEAKRFTPQPHRENGSNLRKKAGGRISAALEDDSDEEKPAEVPKSAVKTAILEDDSSGSEKPEKAPKTRPNPPTSKVHFSSSVSKSPLNEDNYASDSFEEDSQIDQKPREQTQPERLSIREMRRVSGVQAVSPNPRLVPQRPASKGGEGLRENVWLRPASQAEDRKTHSKRTYSNEPREKALKSDLVIRSSRSPAVRQPVKCLLSEDDRQAAQSRTQYRQPSGVQIGITEVEEVSEEDDSPRNDMLAFIKEKLITGGQMIDDSEQLRLKEYHRLQIQLQEQKDRETHFQEVTRQQEEDLLLKEKQYQSLAEEVEEQRKVIQKLRVKYKSALREIEDLGYERETEKEDLLDSIREKDRELAFYQKIAGNLLTGNDIAMVKQRAKYDDESKEWTIPPFLLQQNKQTVFPKLPAGQAKEMMEKELRTRTLMWQGEGLEDEEAADSLKKYQWLTKADSLPLEIDNRPPTSGNKSRQMMSRHGRNQLLDPLSEKAPSNTFPTSISYDQSMHTTPLSKKRTLKPQDGRVGKKTSEIS